MEFISEKIPLFLSSLIYLVSGDRVASKIYDCCNDFLLTEMI